MKVTYKRLISALFIGVLLQGISVLSVAHADALSAGKHEVILLDNKGNRYPIGSLSFSTADPDGQVSYHWELDHHRFTDHFLSMKEMKCLQGPELWCFIPYPYDNPRLVSQTDLRWLEHDLLFLFKRNAEFGANFWNGIYYKLRVEEGALIGEAQSLDLNMLASPPDDLSVPPVGEFDREEADLEKRWLPKIIID